MLVSRRRRYSEAGTTSSLRSDRAATPAPDGTRERPRRLSAVRTELGVLAGAVDRRGVGPAADEVFRLVVHAVARDLRRAADHRETVGARFHPEGVHQIAEVL